MFGVPLHHGGCEEHSHTAAANRLRDGPAIPLQPKRAMLRDGDRSAAALWRGVVWIMLLAVSTTGYSKGRAEMVVALLCLLAACASGSTGSSRAVSQ